MTKFEIFEKDGRGSSISKDYPNDPVVRLSGKGCILNMKAVEVLRIPEGKKGSELLLSKAGDHFYIANVTDHWKPGFAVRWYNYKGKSIRSAYFYRSIKMEKDNIESGAFYVKEIVYDDMNKIDWHKLVKI